MTHPTMTRPHVITGATGLLGSALLLELLQRTTSDIWCLVRAGDENQAMERITAALRSAANAYGSARHLHAGAVESRCHPLPGDIQNSRFGLSERRLPRAALFWHCAATLQYHETAAADIETINVRSVQQALDLCRATDAQLNYVSTAYVAGRGDGVRFEVLPDLARPVRNLYESSKARAETLVSRSAVPWRIMRPSIISAHSTSGKAPSGTPVSRLLGKLQVFRDIHLTSGTEELTVPADSETELNFVPVDLAAGALADVGTLGPTATVFHITNKIGTKIGTVYPEMFRRAGLPEPILSTRNPEMTALDVRLAEIMEFDLQYAVGHQTFDRSNTDRVIGGDTLKFAITENALN
ncbi:SDR family oxidoreductase [Actinomadura rubrisoli]|nr:SDR family oxidoreductase [Actinomadura rubrisoli]